MREEVEPRAGRVPAAVEAAEAVGHRVHHLEQVRPLVLCFVLVFVGFVSGGGRENVITHTDRRVRLSATASGNKREEPHTQGAYDKVSCLT